MPSAIASCAITWPGAAAGVADQHGAGIERDLQRLVGEPCRHDRMLRDMYMGSTLTPCESCPRRFASTRCTGDQLGLALTAPGCY
jgi:hypothetical protein